MFRYYGRRETVFSITATRIHFEYVDQVLQDHWSRGVSSNVSARLLDTIFKWDLLLIRRVGGNSFLRCNGPYNVSLIAILGLRNGHEVSYTHVRVVMQEI